MAFQEWDKVRTKSRTNLTDVPEVLFTGDVSITYETSWCTQFGALFRRNVYKTIAEKMLARVRMIQMVFMGLLIGSIYAQLPKTQATFQDRLSVMFLVYLPLSI